MTYRLGILGGVALIGVGACGNTITVEKAGSTTGASSTVAGSSSGVTGFGGDTGNGGGITIASVGSSTFNTSSSGSPATNSTTASTSGAGGGIASDVTGTMIYRYYGEAAPVDVPANLAGAQVEAFVWSGSAWTTYPGSGDSSGNFTVPSVPPGGFMIDVGGVYAYTSERVLDLGADVGGRPTATYGTGSNTVAGTVSGLDPWGPNDSLQWNAPNAAGGAYGFVGATPSSGDTTLMNQPSPWQGYLIDAAHADVLYLTQLSLQNIASPEVQTVTRFASFTGVEQIDGVPVTVSGALSPVAANESTSVDLRSSQFAALGAAVSPNAGYSGTSFAVLTQPGATAAGAFGYSIELLTLYSSTTSDTKVASLAYGNPFPAAWGELAYVSGTWSASYTAPGASQSAPQYGYVYQTLPAAQAATIPLVPQVSPPLGLTIEGKPAAGPIGGVGVTPTLTWSPPAIGTPNAYHVVLYEVAANGNATSLTYRAELVTTTTSLTMPPSLLVKGHAYAFTVTAIVSPIDATTKPFHWSATIASADTLTGVVTP